MRLLSLIKFDIQFQLRHGFYFAYIFVSIVFLLIIGFIPSDYREMILIVFLLADTSVIGFLFIGGIILLEKDMNTHESLFVTPVQIGEYIISKTISLTIISISVAAVITLFSVGVPKRPLALFAAVLLGSVLFTLSGIIIVTSAENLNQYFVRAMPLTVIIVPPFAAFFGFISSRFLDILPPQSLLALLSSGIKGDTLEFHHFVFLLIWIVAVYFICKRQFRKYLSKVTGAL